MRGRQDPQASMLALIDMESRVPLGHPLRTIMYMAEEALDRAMEAGDLPRRPCLTENLHLHGWIDRPQQKDPEGLQTHGPDAAMVLELAQTRPELQGRLHPRLPYTGAHVIWETRNTMARTVEDILARRTRALFLDAGASMAMAPRVAQWMAEEMNRDKMWEEKQVKEFEDVARGYLPKT